MGMAGVCNGWRYDSLRSASRRIDKKLLLVPAAVILTLIILSILTRNPSHKKQHNAPVVPHMKQHPDYMSLPRRFPCSSRSTEFRIVQHGEHWALHNLAAATKTFRCDESVTFATHADENDDLRGLEELVAHWAGPVSLSLHTTRMDFRLVVAAIRYSRSCLSPMVQQLVSFHVYFSTWNVPDIAARPALHREPYNCSLPPPWYSLNPFEDHDSKLYTPSDYYPVNAGRNIAIEAAGTHCVLSAELNMLPSFGIISEFLNYIRKHPIPNRRIVFAVPVFLLGKNVPVPDNKLDLVELWKRHNAEPYWSVECSTCDLVPELNKWGESDGSGVFQVAKRIHKNAEWEPFYIGTREDPQQDERHEVRGDKSLQNFAMCLLDYEFHILKNAFLVVKWNSGSGRPPSRPDEFTYRLLEREYKAVYGNRKGCVL